jgi:hypothetical protein
MFIFPEFALSKIDLTDSFDCVLNLAQFVVCKFNWIEMYTNISIITSTTHIKIMYVLLDKTLDSRVAILNNSEVGLGFVVAIILNIYILI